ncbi:MAG: AMP-binding protein [Gammaproteobacteria bacterium]|nr:AMP-binding protein [Gammaproteobacteria bacterium]
MNLLEQKIREFACQQSQKIAVQGDNITLDYQGLVTEIETLSSIPGFLSAQKYHSYAIIMDNHPAWAVLDLALMFNKQCAVPLPKFFSIEQLKHSLIDSQVEHLIIDESQLTSQLIKQLDQVILGHESLQIAGKKLSWYRLDKTLSHLKSDNPPVAKITYTSGTTDKPKGVLLSEDTIITKVVSLASASEANENDIALSILPLSTLLENIGGLYVPLFCGATVTLLSPQRIGISGSSQIDPQKILHTIQNYKPTAFIIIPQLLQLLIKAVQDGHKLPDSIRFIAMGGAPVSRHLLDIASQLEIPVFEGYGLSEAASVVAVNNPSTNRLGSVGKVLDSHQLKISEEGEIYVKNHLFSGYLGQKGSVPEAFYSTGDIGKLDDEGFLYITGRKKNIINTSYGRNISPEWIEKELEAIPQIAQCLVYGHGKPYLVALLVLRDVVETGSGSDKQSLDSLNAESIPAALKKLNAQLPDYARVIDFIVTDKPFNIQNNQLTGTGRPRRAVIYQAYQDRLEQCYAQVNDMNGETM